MNAVRSLLANFFDYAGLYPPASLSLRSAANRYLEYASGEHAWALGRFIIDAGRLDELRASVGEDALRHFKLSVIVKEIAALEEIPRYIETGLSIESVEIKSAAPESIEHLAALPKLVGCYIEIPFDSGDSSGLRLMSGKNARAKIRMGGVVPEAFPQWSDVVRMLSTLAKLRIPFKATAGLHHPIRSEQPLTYEAASAKVAMHGFLNLCCAAAVLYFGGAVADAESVLRDEDRAAWDFDQVSLRWRHLSWTQDQLSTLRREFFMSIGSCSFEEPIRDLEGLGWL
jgi:hypothetical protein